MPPSDSGGELATQEQEIWRPVLPNVVGLQLYYVIRFAADESQANRLLGDVLKQPETIFLLKLRTVRIDEQRERSEAVLRTDAVCELLEIHRGGIGA